MHLGSPAGNVVFYELYGSPAQIQARSHPNVIHTHKSLLTSLFHASPTTPVSLHTPISYFDRLRIRPPGPSQFTLGPHMDGGSIERWEDEQYSKVYRTLFKGGKSWRDYDAWNLTERVGANQDLYSAPYALSSHSYGPYSSSRCPSQEPMLNTASTSRLAFAVEHWTKRRHPQGLAIPQGSDGICYASSILQTNCTS